jgi:hypothetical protein
MPEEIKQRTLAAAKKMLTEFQQRNSFGVPIGPKRKKRKEKKRKSSRDNCLWGW